MKSTRQHPILAGLALALAASFPLLHATPAWAAPVPSQQGAQAGDPPGRVGRISQLQGQVWLYHPEDGEWSTASLNRPLTTGDRLATDGGARGEVRIGSTVLRLDGATELEVARLDDEGLSLRLHNGSVAVRLASREQAAGFELFTDEGRFTAQSAGRYRFDREDDASFATVLAGQAYYETRNNALTVYPGQRAEFWIDGANVPQYSIVDPQRDGFSGWVAERERADERGVSSRYVSPEMTGAEDLDRYGSWQENPEYGALWVPRAVAPGWAPYTTGHWAWVAPWGWTWVDDAPWGFAPFHYGRWVYVGASWCWSPGRYAARPVYAPALVAWLGGPNLSVGISIGGGSPGPAVGWVPLAPREVYVPTYHVSPGYVRNVNVTQVTNITNINMIVNNPQQAVAGRDFRNRKFPNAVTVVPAATLAERQPVAPVAARWREAPAVRNFVAQPPHVANVAAPPVAAPTPGPRRPDSPVARPPLQAAPAPRAEERKRTTPFPRNRDEAGGRPVFSAPAEPQRGALQPSVQPSQVQVPQTPQVRQAPQVSPVLPPRAQLPQAVQPPQTRQPETPQAPRAPFARPAAPTPVPEMRAVQPPHEVRAPQQQMERRGNERMPPRGEERGDRRERGEQQR